MKQGNASVTSIGSATRRAIHQLVDDPKVFTDPLAVRLMEAAAPGAIAAGLQTFCPPDLKESRAIFVLRSRFVEDELAGAVTRGVTQYVILGAGLDTFAYRQPAYASSLQIFEVDHPTTQAWKRESLAVADIQVPSNLRWVPVNFERQTFSEQLIAAGFDSRRPAFFSWLGVTQYLTLPAIDDTLRFVAGLPTASTIILTYVLSDDTLTEEDRTRKHRFAERAATSAEPWLTFFSPGDFTVRLLDLGFGRVLRLTPDQANARYFAGRADGMHVTAFEQLVSATV